MEYLVKMNEKLLKVFPRSFPKIKMEQTLLLVTILISLVTLLIHNHIYQLDVSRENIMKSKTDLIREKTIEMNNKLDSLELNCPENPACPVCPSCPECPSCNCPEEKEKVCPDCNCPTCPTAPVVQKDTGATVTGATVTGASGAKPFRETDGVDSLENSNNLFSNFYSLFSKDKEGDVPIVNSINSNKNTNNNSNKNTNNNSNKNTNNNSNKNTNNNSNKNTNNSNKNTNNNSINSNSNILGGEMDGFEKVPGYAIVPER